jgi:hypothetical protein
MMYRLIHFVVFSAATVVAADWASAEDRIDYIKRIKPILSAKCYSCHGAFKREAELRLETRALMLQGGDSGEVIVAGEADASLLIERITAEEDERMPPLEEGGTLKAEEIALFRAWINQGAETPMEETPGDPREHWAYRKPVCANVPQVKNVRWVRNPIDAFLVAGHEQLGLVPAPRADKSTLLRRVYLDLIGLPPTRQQLQAFLADESKDAYDKVVRDLLESPRYGERWGRHWMDIWRYSDWSGYRNEVRNSQRHIWRWRDWIIQSLNEDKSYELAFRMPTSVPGVVDFRPETATTRRLYGIDQKNTRPFGEQLLVARRLVEQGVRFVQVYHGSSGGAGAWDQHSNLKAKHSQNCAAVDMPIAGLIKDLKQRGVLDETLIVWATEFGRSPGSQGSNGRDHHPFGFSVWLAGGGIKGGVTHGATDDLGFHAVEDRHYVTDIHATLMQQLGLDPRRLAVLGRQRLDIDFGHPINEIIA